MLRGLWLDRQILELHAQLHVLCHTWPKVQVISTDCDPGTMDESRRIETTPMVWGLLAVFASVLAGAAAWSSWERAQRASKYDLTGIPGPKQLPLIGNLGDIIGSSYLHRVGSLSDPIITASFRSVSLLETLSGVQCFPLLLCARRYGINSAVMSSRLYTGVCPHSLHKFCTTPCVSRSVKNRHAGAGKVDKLVWVSVQMECGRDAVVSHHGPR